MATKPPSKKPPTPGAPTAASPTASVTAPSPAAPATSKPLIKPTINKPPTSPVKSHIPKTFAISSWTGANEGEKIVIFAKSGGGKTTLASMAPNAVFIGVDDGGRKIVNPLTGQHVNVIQGITSFQDIRDALHQTSLYAPDSTIVIDTLTKAESMAEPYIFEHYKVNNASVSSMRKYGWDGPAHQLEVMRLLLSDLDAHIRAGRSAVLLSQLAQIRVANAEGLDYLEDGPKLQHNNQYSSRTEVCEWADHVFRIGYVDFNVQRDTEKSKVAKVTSSDTTRAVFTGGAQHFIAKTRPVTRNRTEPYSLPPVISFSAKNDNSLWQMVFDGASVE